MGTHPIFESDFDCLTERVLMSAEDLKNQGNQALKVGNIKEAIDLYGKAIATDSTNKVFFSNRSAAYMKAEDYRSALTDGEQAIELAPTWAKGYSRKGAALYALARFEEAKIAYEEASKLEPANATFKDEVTRCASQLTGPGGSQPLGGAGGNPLGQNPAEIFRRLSTDARTKEYMSDPSYVQMLQDLSMDPAVPPEPKQQKKQEEEMIEDPIEDDKEEAKREKEMGNGFYKKKDFDNALKHYDNAINLDPENMVYYNNKAAVYVELKRYQDARDLSEKAADIGRSNRADFTLIAKAYARIATCHEKESNLELAIKYFNKSLSEHRDKKILDKVNKIEKTKRENERQAYWSLEKAEEERATGNECFKKGAFPDAVKHYNEGIKRTPDNESETLSKFYSNRAGAYMKLMDFNRAQKDCEEAIKLNPGFVKAHIRKGAVQEAMKQHDNAAESYQEALRLDPNAKEASEGINRTMMAKYASRNAPEAVKQRAMNDPEVAQIMGDPTMRMILEQMQQNPSAAAEHMRNPAIARKVQKLVDVGLISMSSR